MMYFINNKCQEQFNSNSKKNGEQIKISKLFRPWDNFSNINQDDTVSTTTSEENEEINNERINQTKPKINTEKNEKKEIGFRPISNKTKIKDETSLNCGIIPSSSSSPLFVDYQNSLEGYPSLYPEILQSNLAQNLGLPSNDPLILESLSQGYALEEYARILNQEHQTKLLNARKQRPKKYKCPHCEVGFSNNGQLKGHIRIHTGERPFKCDEKDCGKTFTRNEELTRHKRIHSGLRPYPCTHCGKRFGRKDHLKKHSRTHFQSRGLYAVPVMLPFDTWMSSSTSYPYVPMYGF